MRHLTTLPHGATSDTSVTLADLTPTEEIAALEMPSSAGMGHLDRPNRPIFFSRDGTVSGKSHTRPERDEKGKSMDVHELLRTTDWAATSLGPMDKWPQSLKTAGGSSGAVSVADKLSEHGDAVPESVYVLIANSR